VSEIVGIEGYRARRSCEVRRALPAADVAGPPERVVQVPGRVRARQQRQPSQERDLREADLLGEVEAPRTETGTRVNLRRDRLSRLSCQFQGS
jgi:hypothetical protein